METSAAHRVFAIPELLEAILEQVADPQGIDLDKHKSTASYKQCNAGLGTHYIALRSLVRCKQVRRSWKATIDRSPRLQRAQFLTVDKRDDMYQELLTLMAKKDEDFFWIESDEEDRYLADESLKSLLNPILTLNPVSAFSYFFSSEKTFADGLMHRCFVARIFLNRDFIPAPKPQGQQLSTAMWNNVSVTRLEPRKIVLATMGGGCDGMNTRIILEHADGVFRNVITDTADTVELPVIIDPLAAGRGITLDMVWREANELFSISGKSEIVLGIYLLVE